MNIIHLTPYVPSIAASHAGGVCMGKQLEWLTAHHNVSLFTFVNDNYERHLLEECPCPYVAVESTTAARTLNALATPSMPLLFGIRNSRDMRNKLTARLNRGDVDAIHIEYTSMGQYLDLKKRFPEVKFVLTEHDVTQQSFQRRFAATKGLARILQFFELSKVKKCESSWCSLADTVITFSDKDCALLNDLYKLRTPAIRLNPYYGVGAHEDSACGCANKICFIGQMGRSENEEAALRLLRIYQDYGLSDICELTIIGAHPSDKLKKAAQGVARVTGFVQDINDAIKQCGLAVFPLESGAGIKLKVLLAASLGLPVITTLIGAEGIDESGEALVVRNSDSEIASAIRWLINDHQAYLARKEAIALLIESSFAWKKSEEVLSHIYPSS